ncbi:hypothetical protein [Peribacillus sp. ACCC06369]|uniref:hypothetical protein n=1 Tax=Peribacillus sp. ACCC06369 TaxID=3055860 RepID=UPI0025A16FD8|nr:hypothetical protein [Peribacillus sp. ACCC06369]MDM5358796.1 hypothetical protein [Peribacillus sp. ACCC06369]
MSVLRVEYQNSKEKQHQEQLERAESESEDDSGKVSKQENSFFDGAIGKVEKAEKIVSSAGTIVGTTLDLIKTLTSMGKLL